MRIDRRRFVAGLTSLGGAASMRVAHAQTVWPDKTVRIIVPFPAGGTADIIPRIVANALGDVWKQPIIVDNRPGAAGNIGTALVAGARPDGYTLLAAPPPPIAINQSLYAKLSFDPSLMRAVTVMASAPNIVGVSKTLGVSTLAEFIALAKAKPGALNVANQGLGSTSHLTAAMFETAAGVRFNQIPYSGTAPALNDLVGGHVDAFFDNIASSLPQHLAGTIRIVGVCSAQRAPQLPDVPTVAESGYPGVVATAWYAMMAPAGTPDDLIGKISHDVGAAIRQPDVTKLFIDQAAQPIGNSPEEAQAFIARERKSWADVIKAADVHLHQ